MKNVDRNEKRVHSIMHLSVYTLKLSNCNYIYLMKVYYYMYANDFSTCYHSYSIGCYSFFLIKLHNCTGISLIFILKSMVMILVKKDFLILMFTMFKLDILIGNQNLSYKQVTIICYVNKAFWNTFWMLKGKFRF